MPRIRTLKPEAIQHRKVGRLSDRGFRLWIALLTQADDDGRVVADSGQLRSEAFGYHQAVTETDVEMALQEVARTKLVLLYKSNGTRYAVFPSWHEHQRIHKHHYTPSRLPPPPGRISTVCVPYQGGIGTAGSERIGSDQERIGEERSKKGESERETSTATPTEVGSEEFERKRAAALKFLRGTLV